MSYIEIAVTTVTTPSRIGPPVYATTGWSGFER
jgi:hypothetical protein